MAALTIEELDVEIARVKEAIKALDAQHNGEALPEEARSEWNALNEQHDEYEATRGELVARKARVEKLYGQDENRESEPVAAVRSNTSTRKRVPDDPSDLSAYRKMAGNVDELHKAYLEGALRINERMTPADPYADVERTQAHVEKVLRTVDSADDRSFARRVINTSNPTYERAFGKYITGGHRTQEEDRALSLTTTSGGYAVPYTLDPTVILTSAGRINPIRQLAQVRTITGNTWYGVSSTGITAAFSAEATEASDNAPTLAQPTASVEKAQAFIPFSIEIGQDWSGIQSEMAMLFSEAKEDLEAEKYLTGLGHASSVPQGLIAVGGATAVVSTATTGVIAVADLYSLEIALQVRSRSRAVFLANKAFYQKVRQFDTYGGANLWVQLGAGNPAQLLGYDAYEWGNYSSATTTSGSTVATFGDPSKFLIVDRVGMDVELIPHLFSTANNRPTGQRGLYCYWRTTSTVLTPGLSANSAFQSLKVL